MATKKTQPVELPENAQISLHTGPAGNKDYVEFGSEQHAYLLLLQPAEEGDQIVQEDDRGRKWTLADITNFPPGTTEQYLKAILGQRIRVLVTVPKVPKNALPLWVPSEQSRGIVG